MCGICGTCGDLYKSSHFFLLQLKPDLYSLLKEEKNHVLCKQHNLFSFKLVGNAKLSREEQQMVAHCCCSTDFYAMLQQKATSNG
jgi:hypothetical protein